ncbi:MAG: hypothetical protein Q8O41_10940 [Candidatus Methanoperedens sp.]|nr:hypothetical protein [Candidatus Methanoperedens sp.]
MSFVDKISKLFTEKAEKEGKNANKLKVYDCIGKFVKQNNVDLGESIAIDGGRLIVKNPDGFMSVPLEAIVTNTDSIVVVDFNREESLQLGKEWFERKDTLKFDEKGMLVK